MADQYLDSAAHGYQHRARRLMLLVTLAFGGLLARLVHLQLIEGGELQESGVRNFMRQVTLPADRGTIYDRNGVVLAINRPAFDLYVTPSKVVNLDALVAGLREVLSLDPLDAIRLREKIEEPRGWSYYRPVRIQRDVDRDLVSRVEALRALVDGLSVQVEYQRKYPFDAIGAHVLGYLGKPRPSEMSGGNPRHFLPDTMIGRFGLERRYDEVLAGQTGMERYVVNARGAKQEGGWAKVAMKTEALRIPPQRGNDVWLTVDAEVQKIIVEAMARYESGAAVVMNPNNGEVLGLISKPSYDPNEWSGHLSKKSWETIQENPYNPMLDKSVHSYFPGSIYKVVTALAGMEEGVLDPEEKIESPGSYEYGNHIFHCHKRSGHGKLNVYGAMTRSADVYFYKLGETLGIDRQAKYARRFGFGERTSIRINGESAGVVPDAAFYRKHGGFQAGLALSTAIGQGDVRTTPLQMAVAYSALANGGTVWEPSLVNSIKAPDGATIETFTPKKKSNLTPNFEYVSIIGRALESVVNAKEHATGHNAKLPYGKVAGKTGTAQVRKINRGFMRQNVTRFKDRDHAWFASYAPVESPRIVVIVFLEHGGSGGKDAAPVAKYIIEAYHQRIEPIFRTTASNNKRKR